MLRPIAVVALLAFALSPVTGLRPLADFAAILTHPFKTESNPLTTAVPAEKPWFCHDLDCPRYQVINQTADYETRKYEKGKWAHTRVEGLLYTPSLTTGFKRLFDYISGENDSKSKIPMTSPVLTWVQPGQGPFCKSNFSVAFFVPFEFADNTPKPTDPAVSLLASPEGVFYVSQFGGYLIDDITLGAKVKALREHLVENDESFEDAGDYFTAGYDPPFRVQHRHNEIWIKQTEKAVRPT